MTVASSRAWSLAVTITSRSRCTRAAPAWIAGFPSSAPSLPTSNRGSLGHSTASALSTLSPTSTNSPSTSIDASTAPYPLGRSSDSAQSTSVPPIAASRMATGCTQHPVLRRWLWADRIGRDRLTLPATPRKDARLKRGHSTSKAALTRLRSLLPSRMPVRTPPTMVSRFWCFESVLDMSERLCRSSLC